MTVHCMVDIETLGVECVVQIGAVKFSEEDETLFDTFSVNIDPIVGNGPVDPATVVWWLKQSAEARELVFDSGTTSLDRGLKAFTSWWKEKPEADLLWCHATYDAVVLDKAYGFRKLRTPWHYRDVRDLRTLFGMAKIATGVSYGKNKPRYTSHDGLSDARLQVDVWRDVVKALKEDGVQKIG